MNKRKIFSIVVAMFMAFATFVVPVSAADTYSAKLYGKITDQTCPIMIQRLNNIFQRNPLISIGI